MVMSLKYLRHWKENSCMLILKSEVSTSPKLKGHSLVSLCKLSLVNSSRLNLSKLTDFVTNFSGGLFEVSFNKPEAYFHASDMRSFLFDIVVLVNKGVHIEFAIYGDEIVNLVGRFIADGYISSDLVELQLELPPRLDEEHGEIDIVHFDSEGYLKAPYRVGYFSY